MNCCLTFFLFRLLYSRCCIHVAFGDSILNSNLRFTIVNCCSRADFLVIFIKQFNCCSSVSRNTFSNRYCYFLLFLSSKISQISVDNWLLWFNIDGYSCCTCGIIGVCSGNILSKLANCISAWSSIPLPL